MPKETTFKVSVFIEITFYDTKLTTCCQIDNGSEASLAKSFLIKDWDLNKSNISMIGITGDKEKLSKSKEKVEIILG